jgi:hypothetical protein
MMHPDDGALLRFLDMDTSGHECDELSEHLGRCSGCSERLEDIRDTMCLVAAALSRTDVSVRKRSQRALPRILAVAATILLAVAVYFTPLRAWVVERARGLWSVSNDVDVQVPLTQQEVDARAPSSGSVSFITTSDVFLIEVTSWQEAGSLAVTVGSGEMATATIRGDLIDESLFVLPGGIRIVNTTASTTAYTVVLPPGVGRIEVQIANEGAVVLQPSDTQRAWTIPMASQ